MLHDKYVGDSNGFQSDQPALMEGSELAMLKLQRLSPSVRCDNNSMSLHIQGSRVPNFLVETGKEGPVPLFQMPSNCGFSVKRARRDLALVANYDGCNVVQQGDAYILPLRYLGVGMKVVCPMARPLSTVFCSRSAMVVNLCPSLEGLWVKVNGLWQPVHQVATCGFTLKPVAGGLTLTAPYTSRCWQFERAERILSVKYSGVELTLSCPAVATLPAEGHPGTPTTTSTTMTTPASADQPQWLTAFLELPQLPLQPHPKLQQSQDHPWLLQLLPAILINHNSERILGEYARCLASFMPFLRMSPCALLLTSSWECLNERNEMNGYRRNPLRAHHVILPG
ncbi:hypothetical protein KOW79_017648 [Hemibagrus wyckioides]|uniref:Uncharacterized protein n=1 Tax=Hemibagrus wyckioides TaxID=337641 RepID=A0A9D3SHF8_9TELE|nr:hypothetical protein KOW79_017648 [Hemibagrus wyckioides]